MDAGACLSAEALQQHRLHRLRQLGVVLAPLERAETQSLQRRFAEAFVDPLRQDEFLWALSLHRALEHHRFLRADGVRPLVPAGSALAWLSAGSTKTRCYRLEREPWLPAVHVVPGSLEEAWIGSWPGVFVSFDAARALVVTLDYERVYCDLRGRAPYR